MDNEAISIELSNAIKVCNNNLDTRLREAIKNNMFSKVHIEHQGKEPISVARLDGNLIITDNRNLRIEPTKNIVKKLINLFNNLVLIIRGKYGII